MTALAAAARAILEAVLVLAAVAAVFRAAVSGPGFGTVVWLAVMFVAITGAVLGVHALQPKRPAAGSCNCPCDCPGIGQRDDDWMPGWCDPCRMNIHQEA